MRVTWWWMEPPRSPKRAANWSQNINHAFFQRELSCHSSSLSLSLSLSPRTDRTRPTQSPSFWRRRRRRRRSREHLSPRCSRPLSFRAGPQKGRLQIRERENCHRQLLFLPRVNKEMKKNVRKMLWKRWMQACGETQNMSSIVGECGLLPTKATFLMGREVTTFQMKYPLKSLFLLITSLHLHNFYVVFVLCYCWCWCSGASVAALLLLVGGRWSSGPPVVPVSCVCGAVEILIRLFPPLSVWLDPNVQNSNSKQV